MKALPLVHFNYINTVNTSTGFTPFQLRFERSPRIILPLCYPDATLEHELAADQIIRAIESYTLEA